MKKTFLRIVGVFVATLTLCLGALPAYAAEKEYHHPRSFREGDVIYYDNSKTSEEFGWDNVRIFFFSKSNGTPLQWVDRPEMEHVKDNIYKYVIPTKDEFCRQYGGNYTSDYYLCNMNFSWDKYDQLIFSDNEGGGGLAKQTINLAFLESGYIYKGEYQEQEYGNIRGYWYLYDKHELINLLNDAKDYAAKIDCVDEDEAKSFVGLVSEIDGKVNDEMRVYTDPDATSGEYWTYSDEAIAQLTEALEVIKEKYGDSPNLCKDKDNPDTFDTIGLFAGLGVASFAGLAIALNKKRRV